MKHRLEQLAAEFGGSVQGTCDKVIVGISPLDQPHPDHLSPLLHHRYLDQATTCEAGALLTDPQLASGLAEKDGRPLWIHEQPRLALALLLQRFFSLSRQEVVASRHPTAVIHPTARIHESCRIEPLVVVEADVEIGSGCTLGARAFVGAHAKLGSHCELGPGAMILNDCLLGDRVRVGPGAVIGADGFGYLPGKRGAKRVPQVGHVVIEDDVDLGALTTIDRATIGATIIRRGAKLDNLIQVGHNVEIGPGAMLAAQCGLAGSSKVGEGAMLGGQVGVGDHLQVGARAKLAGKSGVVKDIPANATYAGYPAAPRFQWLRLWASLLRGRSSSKDDE